MLRAASLSPSWRRHQVILASLIAAAWLVLVTWAMTPYAALLDHHAIEEGAFPAAVRWPAFVAGWTLMVVAMMLPASLPAVKAFVQDPAAKNARPGQRLPAYLLGYVLIWVGFGAALCLGDTFLHTAVDDGLLPHSAEHLIPVGLLVVAGLYQFTPLKRRCLHNHDVRLAPPGATSNALRSWLSAGILCVGTCGAGMLVMFALGGGVNLAFMAAFTVYAVFERIAVVGRQAAWVLGCALLVWAGLMLVV